MGQAVASLNDLNESSNTSSVGFERVLELAWQYLAEVLTTSSVSTSSPSGRLTLVRCISEDSCELVQLDEISQPTPSVARALFMLTGSKSKHGQASRESDSQ